MARHDYDEEIAHHPHGGLVSRIFTDPEAAAAALRQVLPATRCARLDGETLRVAFSSFIDPALKFRHRDILCSIATRGCEIGSRARSRSGPTASPSA